MRLVSRRFNEVLLELICLFWFRLLLDDGGPELVMLPADAFRPVGGFVGVLTVDETAAAPGKGIRLGIRFFGVESCCCSLCCSVWSCADSVLLLCCNWTSSVISSGTMARMLLLATRFTPNLGDELLPSSSSWLSTSEEQLRVAASDRK